MALLGRPRPRRLPRPWQEGMSPRDVARPATAVRSRQYPGGRPRVWTAGDEQAEPTASPAAVTASPRRGQTALPPRTPPGACRTRLMRSRAAGCGVVAEGRCAVHWKGRNRFTGAGHRPVPRAGGALRSGRGGVRRPYRRRGGGCGPWPRSFGPVPGRLPLGQTPRQRWPEPPRKTGRKAVLSSEADAARRHRTRRRGAASEASKPPKPPRRPADGSGGRRPPMCSPPPAPRPDPGPDAAGGREPGTHRPSGPARHEG